ncbi:mate-domain-containing protein [Infundibulicybe gibba]|nr:mate-domain-containing protein [Infundibulicybe gibba]
MSQPRSAHNEFEDAARTPRLPNDTHPTETTPLIPPPCDDPPGLQSTDFGDKWDLILFKEEMRTLTRYALPIFGTQLLEYSLVMVPVIAIGHLSTTALAGITIGSMTGVVSGYSIIQGLSSALDTVLPSAWTSSQPNLVGVWTQRMAVIVAASLIPMFFVWFNATPILLALKQDPEVVHLASIYLRWASLGLPAFAFNSISRRYYQSQGLFTVPTQIIIIVAPINALLNYFLVWGPAPIRLGFIGAPIATAISFNLISVLSLLYGIFFVPRTAWHPLSRRMFSNLGTLSRLGVAGVGQTVSEWWAWELIGLAASMLGPVALASQSVILVSASTMFQAPFALANATAVRIGNLLGEKNAVRARSTAHSSVFMGLILAVMTSILFLVFRNSWALLFNNDPVSISRGVPRVIRNPLVALYQLVDGNSAVTAGILRARGLQTIGALLNVSAYYIIGIPVGVWLAFRRDYGLHGLWVGLTLALTLCSIVGTWLCFTTDWDVEVAKVMKRLREDQKNTQAHVSDEV